MFELIAQSDPAPWWKVTAGIIAIPAALIGLIYTYRLAQKTRLESIKLERELAAEPEVSESRSDTELLRDAEKRAAKAGVIAARTQNFIIRYIILELAIRAWSAFVSICIPLLVLAANLYFDGQKTEAETEFLTTRALELIVTTLVMYINSFGYVVLFVLIGWPLLKDVTLSMGFKPSDLLKLKTVN